MAIRLPHTREKIALRYESWASAIDAGVPQADAIGASGETMLAAMQNAGAQLNQVERSVFEASERAGDLPRALRDRAGHERSMRTLQIDLIKHLAYPALLAIVTLLIATSVSTLADSSSVVWYFWGGALIVVLLGVWLWRKLHSSVEPPLLLSGAVTMDYAAVPYLATLRALYRAGVPIIEAHQRATEATPAAFVRARLFHAGQDMEERQRGFVDALTEQRALDIESLQLLRSGEQSGDLEDSLDRLIERRTFTLTSGLGFWSKIASTAVYVLAAGIAVKLIVTFYTNYFNAIGG